MLYKLQRLIRSKILKTEDYNRLVDFVNQSVLSAKGPGVRLERGYGGTALSIKGNAGGTNNTIIAKVDDISDFGAGGYYKCTIQKLDSTDWETNNDICDDTSNTIVVLNLAENGSAIHNLDNGDKIICWKFTDDEGKIRYVGNEVIGRHTFGEW